MGHVLSPGIATAACEVVLLLTSPVLQGLSVMYRACTSMGVRCTSVDHHILIFPALMCTHARATQGYCMVYWR